VCHLDAKRKPAIRQLIEAGVRRGRLVPLAIEGAERLEHWAVPDTLDALPEDAGERVHLLSPFDPLIIQRRRLKLFFDYEHRYEAYVPKEKRVFGYFALPVRMGDEIVAAIDFKTNREKERLQVQTWTWVGGESARAHKATIEQELHRFEQIPDQPLTECPCAKARAQGSVIPPHVLEDPQPIAAEYFANGVRRPAAFRQERRFSLQLA
jgi:uncharacterized protein YcaQ